jgi:DNA-binding HxlR family transcriptional regulator
MPSVQPIDPTEIEKPCPLTAATDALGGKWSLICLYWLADGPKHFAALERLMSGISRKVLTETLRDLEQHGLLTRTPRGDAVDHVDYALSDHGKSVLPVIEAMRGWGTAHVERRSGNGAAV